MPFDAKAIGATLKKIPWWGYAGGGGVALALGYYIHKQMTSGKPASTAGPSTATPAADQGLQMADLAGMPYETFDPGYSSDPYAASDQSNPSGYQPETVPPSGSPPPGPGPAPASWNPDTGFIYNPPPVRVPPDQPIPVTMPPGAPPLPQPGPVPAPYAARRPAVPIPQRPGSGHGGPEWHQALHGWPEWEDGGGIDGRVLP